MKTYEAPRIGTTIIDSRTGEVFGVVTEVKGNICICDNDENQCFIWRFLERDREVLNNIFTWSGKNDETR